MNARRILLTAALVRLIPFATQAAEPVITVAAAVSLEAPLRAAALAFDPPAGAVIRLVPGASGALRKQLENGAPFDVFCAADARDLDPLLAGGLLDPRTRRVLAGNTLVLIAAAETTALTNLAGLTTLPLARFAIGEPAAVPLGRYAREALEGLGFYETLRPRLVLAANARQVLRYVASGDAAAGLVYATDARDAADVRVVAALDARLHAPIRYVGAAAPRAPARAVAFLEFCARADALWARHGFTPAAGAEDAP